MTGRGQGEPIRFRLRSGSPGDTFEIGRLLGLSAARGDVVALSGTLGAGKTLFCQGLAAGLGIDPSEVASPTFTIVSEHAGRLPFHHVDAYRLASPEEGISAGLEEILPGDGVTAVEWPENVANLLPNRCLRVTFLLSEDVGTRFLSFEIPNQSGTRSFFGQCKRYLTGG
jgi:tRNA threonylcarbamoyladenosine biosynthesis protein TsaE